MKKNKNQSEIQPTETSTTYSAPEFSMPEAPANPKMYCTVDINGDQEKLGIDECQTISIKEVKRIVDDVAKTLKEQEKRVHEKIDWESKIDPQYYVLNRQKKDEIEKIYGKKFYEIDIINDKIDKKKYCLLLLQGMRDLLDTRGYESVDYTINHCSPEFVSVTCHITFTPLYPDEPLQNRKYSFGADAHKGNTQSWYGEYLTAAAFNRAMCLCLRNALKINTVCYEEIGAKMNEEDNNHAKNELNSNPVGPHATLQRKMSEKNISFDKIKSTSINKKNDDGSSKFPDAEKWESVLSIPVSSVMEILNGLTAKEKLTS